jgi:two-component system, sensor histidine kinase and response regulator
LRTGEIQFDDGFQRIYGLSGKEPNVREVVISRNHPDDRELATTYVQDMLQAGQTHLRRTFRILRDDGTYRWASAEIIMEFDSDGPARTRGTILLYPGD